MSAGLEPAAGSVRAKAQLSKAGWTVAIATNQSGIARGYYNVATLDAMHLESVLLEGILAMLPRSPATLGTQRVVGDYFEDRKSVV